jgi:hypothetical protein
MRTLSPHEEMTLYETDFAAWCEYAAPRIVARFANATPEVKRETWANLSEPLRAAIEKLRKAAA